MALTATEKNNIIKFIRNECNAYGVKFYLSEGKYVLGLNNIKCGGYFISEPYLKLAATKNSVKNLIHEYCHMRQWIETDFVGQFGLISQWLAGDKKFSKSIRNALELQYLIELDCDKRVIKLLKKFGDTKETITKYIQKSNLYHLLFLIMRDYKINGYDWWDAVSKEQFKNIVDKMPKTFYYNKDKQLTKLKKLMDFYGQTNTIKIVKTTRSRNQY